MDNDIIVNVRWLDGYLEAFRGNIVRAGADLLWIRLPNGSNRHIPLSGVRWYSTDPESHECIRKKRTQSDDQGEIENENY